MWSEWNLFLYMLLIPPLSYISNDECMRANIEEVGGVQDEKCLLSSWEIRGERQSMEWEFMFIANSTEKMQQNAHIVSSVTWKRKINLREKNIQKITYAYIYVHCTDTWWHFIKNKFFALSKVTEKWYQICTKKRYERSFFIRKSLFIFNLICYWILQGKCRYECVVYVLYAKNVWLIGKYWDFFLFYFKRKNSIRECSCELWRWNEWGLDSYKMSINFWCSFL